MIKILNKYENIDAHPVFSKLKHRYKKAFHEAIKGEALTIASELQQTTPIDTGAGAGTKSNLTGTARRAIYPKHPGYGLGGVSGGKLGWFVKGRRGEYSISNPMWRHYLSTINLFHRAHSGFLEKAWLKHKARMASRGINFKTYLNTNIVAETPQDIEFIQT